MTEQKRAASVRQHPSGHDNEFFSVANTSQPRRQHNDTTTIDSSQKYSVVSPRHGVVRGNVWRKDVRKSKHMLRKPPSWAVDVADLERAEACGATWLELHEQESGEVYSVKLATLRERGRRIDRGFGPQIMLMLGYWQTATVKPPDPMTPTQTPLWSVA